ncbi:MAG: RNA polymerase sigma factor [Oscillospiraceae bacterium]|nr:RNA polymerase sigma factor [Oscillospiraceae bacterium]
MRKIDEYRVKEIAYVRYLDGDASALDEIAKEYFPILIAFLRRMVGSVEDAEDLAADTLLVLLTHKEKYAFRSSLKTFLMAIAKNKAYDYMRKKRLGSFDDSFYESHSSSSPEKTILDQEYYHEIWKSIHSLKRDQQMALYLIAVEGMTYEAVAGVMKKSQSNVKVLVHRAREKLKKERTELL